MARLALLAACVLTLCACGGAGDTTAGADGGPIDGGGSTDAATRPNGLFRLHSVDDADAPLTGLLVIDDAAGTATLASGVNLEGAQETGSGTLNTYAFDTTTGILSLTDASFSVMWRPTATPTVLELTDLDGGTKYLFHGLSHTRTETATLAGTVRLGPGGPKALPGARVTYVALLRGGSAAAPAYQLLPDPGLDQALDLDGELSASFELTRTEGALGVERITFGASGIAVGIVVVYQERDGTAGLGRLTVDACGDAEVDCVYGVAPLILAYRDGDSPELAASPYAHLLPGWSVAAPITDARNAAAGAGSLDPTVPSIFDVEVQSDPSTVDLPAVEF